MEPPIIVVDLSWADADPGTCSRCGVPHEWVRPGKTQPTCDCHNLCHSHTPPIRLEYVSGHMVNGYLCPICDERLKS